jgi:putative YphP/YqiW family bacilliredoxin
MRFISNLKITFMPYSPLLIKPFREQLVSNSAITELLTPQDVESLMNQSGTTVVFVNSVCSCAASIGRPGLLKALNDVKVKPTRVVTVFAGQDLEATARFRSFIADIPPSSPSIAFFKDKELVNFIPKHKIENQTVDGLASNLTSIMDEFFE